MTQSDLVEYVVDVDMTEESYSFDILRVGRDRDGALWWARDSGCSCPTPFEDVEFRPIREPGDWDAVQAEAEGCLEAVDAVALARIEWLSARSRAASAAARAAMHEIANRPPGPGRAIDLDD